MVAEPRLSFGRLSQANMPKRPSSSSLLVRLSVAGRDRDRTGNRRDVAGGVTGAHGARSSYTNLLSREYRISATRFLTPSFSKVWCKCTFTVPSLM